MCYGRSGKGASKRQDMAARLKIKAQIMADELIAIGPGKAELLAGIARLGSIAGAGRALGFSYRRTRDMVDTLNICWHEPLVSTTRGGTGHGGASLTPAGQEVLSAYLRLTEALDEIADWHAPALLALLKEPQGA